MIRVFFGNPGCGKTTISCKFMKRNKKRYAHCFCNFPLNDKYNIGYSVSSDEMGSLGEWTFPEHSYAAVDEAGISYNNRKYKTLPQYTIEWFKLHRHYKCDLDFFSQSWEDMDITIRRLADQLWYLRRFGPFTLHRRVYKTVSVDDKTHQIIDAYRMEKMIWFLLQPLRLIGFGFLLPQLKGFEVTFRPFYYRYFDSWHHPDIPVLAVPSDGDLEELGSVSDPVESNHVGAGSPGALARRRTIDSFLKIVRWMNPFYCLPRFYDLVGSMISWFLHFVKRK